MSGSNGKTNSTNRRPEIPDPNTIEAWLKEEAAKREEAVQEAQKRMDEARKNLKAQQSRDEDALTDADAIPEGLKEVLQYTGVRFPDPEEQVDLQKIAAALRWHLSQESASLPADSQRMIAEACDEFRDFLVQKNKQYGDSAIDPVRIFSKASPEEQLLVRMDDKLSRLVRGNSDLEPDEDIIKDLLGYWILLQVVRRKEAERES